MNSDDFEKQLQRQTIRPVPQDWRVEILQAANAASRPPFSPFNPQPVSGWRALLWPCPQAWAGLAAVWFVLLGLHLVDPETAAPATAQAVPPSPEMLVLLHEQKRLFAELISGSEPADMDRPKPFVPRPRSEAAHAFGCA